MQTTGEPHDKAQFFLEASGWNLEKAVDSFYSGKSENDLSVEEQWPPPPSHSARTFASMGDYQRQKQTSKDDDSQSFFAGGSEHSGQLISGPPRDKKPQDLAQDVFDAAKKQGAVPVEEENKTTEAMKKKKKMFVGQGYKLGQNEGPSEVVGKPRLPSSQDEPERRRVIKFWSNGFSIDDGPLREGSSPQDKRFLESVSRGEIPLELRHAVKDGEVHVEIEDHRKEPFQPPKKKMQAFTGEGHKLGNMAPQVVMSTSQQASSSKQNTFDDSKPKPVELAVDPNQPVTQLQIRLADGSRLVGKFNHNHTVGDIRKFINQSKPGGSLRYRLITTFPNRELTDDSATLSDAKLINAVIVQRM